MRGKLTLALVCLHVSAALYVLLAPVMWLLLRPGTEISLGAAYAVFAVVFAIAIAVGVEVVAEALRRRLRWAWIAAVCIFAVYAPSAFALLGVAGLWAMFDRDVRAEFGQAGLLSPAEQPLSAHSGSREADGDSRAVATEAPQR